MVAVGASSAVLGLDETAYLDVVEEIFGRKESKSFKRIWTQLNVALNI